MTRTGEPIDVGSLEPETSDTDDQDYIKSDLVCAKRLLRLAVLALKHPGEHANTVKTIEGWLEEEELCQN